MSAPENANARRQPGERVNELTDEWRLRVSTHDVNATYGPPELCVWQVAPGTFWFQTTDPEYARKLDQRQDARCVEVIGVNHYRRTYEVPGTWRKVKGIVDRYLMRTSDVFSARICPPECHKPPGVPRLREVVP